MAPNTLSDPPLDQSAAARFIVTNTHPVSVALSDRHIRPAMQKTPAPIATIAIAHVGFTERGTAAITKSASAAREPFTGPTPAVVGPRQPTPVPTMPRVPTLGWSTPCRA